MNKMLVLLISCLVVVGGIGLLYGEYSIPQLIPEDYDCEDHPGFISDSNPAPFESGQHYIERKSEAIQKQIEGFCD